MPDAQFTVPYPEHTHFVGREDDLARLHAALQGAGPVGINPAALGNPTGVTGQGGIGKTQLAVAYAYKYREHYPDGVYWLNAAESLWSEFANLGRHFLGQGGEEALKTRLYETLRTRFKVEEVRELCLQLGINYEEFSPNLGISSLARELAEFCERRGQLALLEAAVRRLRGDLAEPQAQDELVAHAFTRLRERSQCLLILDNVADPAALDESLTGDCVPARLPGRVLFTTRRREPGRFQPVELKTLSADKALELLLRDPRRQPVLDPAHLEHEIARDICAVLGHLPLALEIAAAHLTRQPGSSLTAYRHELSARGVLKVMANPRVPVKTLHETGLHAVLSGQWQTLSTEAQTLLRVAGQFPEANSLPVARLGLLAGVPEEGRGFFDVTLLGALAELEDTSLIEELAGGQVRLHPLVREFARDRTPIAEKVTFRAECIRRLLTAIGDIETLERQVDERGIDAILRDLLAAQGLLDGVGQDDTLGDLGIFLRVLRREAHNLRGWRQDDAPSFLAQQLHLQLIDSATPKLFGDLAAQLRRRGPAWLARWAARSESPGLEMTLTSHAGGVGHVAMTPDGRRAVSGSYDGILRVWNLDTGQAEQTLTGHEGSVRAVAVTADGRQVVSGGVDRTVRIWNAETGLERRRLTGHTHTVLAVAMTADGRRVVSSGPDRTVRIWNADTGEEEWTLSGHEESVDAVAITPDGRRVASGGRDGSVRTWDANTGEEEWTLNGHSSPVEVVVVTRDGRRVVSSGRDGTRIWNADTGMEEHSLTQDTWMNTWALTPDGRWRVAHGSSKRLRFWNLETGEERVLTGYASAVSAVIETSEGWRVMSGGGTSVTVSTIKLDMTAEGRTLTDDAGELEAVVVTADGRWAIVGGTHGAYWHIYDLGTGVAQQASTLKEYGIGFISVAANKWWIAYNGADGKRRIWNLHTGMEEQSIPWRMDWLLAPHLATPSWRWYFFRVDEELRFWNIDTNRVEWTLTDYMSWGWDWLNSIAISLEGRRAILGGNDGKLLICNLYTGIHERTLTGHVSRVIAVASTADGRQAVSSGDDKTLRLWDLDTGHELGRAVLDNKVTCVAIAPGNPLVVVAGDAAGSVYCLEWVE